jgi:uncharacterized caspase-like protein
MMRALLISALLLMCCGNVFAARRVALIIANSQYHHVTPLDNPRNDGIAIANLLTTIGFSRDDVTLKFDLGHEAMRKAILDFSLAAESADVALIYFAGHGYGSGINYLIPIDAEMRSARNLPTEAFSERDLEDAVKPAHGLKLVILDACRNDPTKGRMLDAPRTRAITRGLQSVEPDDGVLVAYSAKHGTVAQDGPADGNSPFAHALMDHLGEPEDIRFVFGAVRDDVRNATENEQEPFLYGSLGRQKIYLAETQLAGWNPTTSASSVRDDCKSGNPPLSCLFRER